MTTPISELLLARASTMTEGPVGPLQLMAAANQLQAELISARDALIMQPAAAPADAATTPIVEPEPAVAEATPASADLAPDTDEPAAPMENDGGEGEPA